MLFLRAPPSWRKNRFFWDDPFHHPVDKKNTHTQTYKIIKQAKMSSSRRVSFFPSDRPSLVLCKSFTVEDEQQINHSKGMSVWSSR